MKRGFTLIEILITMTIMSVLAGVATPMFIKEYDQALVTAESEQLKNLTKSLKLYTNSNAKIPGSAASGTVLSWDQAINSVGSSNSAEILTNGAGYSRIYIYPDNFISVGKTLPYDQNIETTNQTLPTTAPLNSKALIISPLKGNLTQGSGAVPAATFDAIWTQVGQPAELTEGAELIIERVGYRDSFSELILNNNEPLLAPQYSINGLPAGNKIMALGPIAENMFIINGSKVSMYDEAGVLDYIHTMNSSISYSFLNGWGGALGIKTSVTVNTTAAITNLTSATGGFSQWGPKAGCVSTGSPNLTVNNISAVNDVNWFYGDIAGNMTFVTKVKAGRSFTFAIPECSLVVITPQDSGPNGFYLFYMGGVATTQIVN